ncbi:ATP-binding protein [Streptomyces sp. P1-3]|uniref:ATP-binding protein n=1 Tax=Streptomyces sp. P1-3 TaxID=3421658 RepID=UPI003D35E825
MNNGTPPLPSDIELHLTRHHRSVPLARELVREHVRAWGLADDAVETALLLLSELVTNSCRHAHVSPGRLIYARCELRDKRLRVEVSDASAELPRPRQAAVDDESGRGLALVAALADDWDVHPRACGVGKTVWFELDVLAHGSRSTPDPSRSG